MLPCLVRAVSHLLRKTLGIGGAVGLSAAADIFVGGLATMVPERRADIVSLAPKAVLSGTLATLLTGSVVGVLTV